VAATTGATVLEISGFLGIVGLVVTGPPTVYNHVGVPKPGTIVRATNLPKRAAYLNASVIGP
jgi:hypothetical protein